MSKLISIFVAVFAFALWSTGSSAQTISITNGYICAPKNPGGEETRLFFRQQEGVAINLSTTAAFPVVCPVIIPLDNPPYFAGADFKNGSSIGQNFACALEEYDPAHNLVKSTGQSIYIPGNGNGYILFQNYYVSNIDNNLSIRCILPPRGMIGAVAFY